MWKKNLMEDSYAYRMCSLVKINLRESEGINLSELEGEMCVVFSKVFESGFRGKVHKSVWVIWMM